MTFGQSMLRAVFRKRETERMALRQEISLNAAYAEELCRTLGSLDVEEVTQRLNGKVARALEGFRAK